MCQSVVSFPGGFWIKFYENITFFFSPIRCICPAYFIIIIIFFFFFRFRNKILYTARSSALRPAPQPGGPGLCIYVPGPVIPPGTG
jgi:hypothetical protein